MKPTASVDEGSLAETRESVEELARRLMAVLGRIPKGYGGTASIGAPLPMEDEMLVGPLARAVDALEDVADAIAEIQREGRAHA